VHVHSQEEFNTLKSSKDKLVVADFSATWCSACKKIKPAFEKFAQQYDAKFLNVDVDEVKGIVDPSGGIPLFKFFKDGKELGEYRGSNETNLEENIKKFL